MMPGIETLEGLSTWEAVLEWSKLKKELWTPLARELGEETLGDAVEDLMHIAALPDEDIIAKVAELAMPSITKTRLNLAVNVTRA